MADKKTSKGDELVESFVLEGIAGAIAKTLTSVKGKPIGFCLLVFASDDNGHTSFVSNLEVEELKDALGEFIDYLRSGKDG